VRFLIPILFCLPLLAAEETALAPITLVVQYETKPAAAAVEAMQTELGQLLGKADRRIEWKLASELKPGESVSELVMVKFKGSCKMETVPQLLDERGPLAVTHVSDGEVLPYSVVLCDKVRVAARSAMHGGQVAKGNELMGRAMARVLAHELYHIAGHTQQHTHSGVTQRALSGAQLIADRLDFDENGLSVLHQKTLK